MDKNKDLLLLKNLSKARAISRRPSAKNDGQGVPAKDEKTPRHRGGRGFGHILDLLKENEGVSSRQITEALGVRAQTVSDAVSVLRERGLVTKQVSPTDKRVTLIYITQRGLSHRERRQLERRDRARQIFSPLTDEEKDTLLYLLSKINHSSEKEEI